MAKYVLQELPEELTDGKKVVFPKIQTYSLDDYETVVKHMHDCDGTFSEGVIRGVFSAFMSVMKIWMPMGHTVKVDGLGVFSLSLGFDTSMASEDALSQQPDDDDPKTKYRHVCIKGINFKPDQELLQELNSRASFDRSSPEVKVSRKTKFSYEERLAKARDIVSANGMMTLTDYALATGLSRAAASADLKRIVADPDSGITARGSRPHKVWVARTPSS